VSLTEVLWAPTPKVDVETSNGGGQSRVTIIQNEGELRYEVENEYG